MRNKGILAIGITIIFIIIVSIGCVEENQKKVENMKISSPAFENGESIPSEYTCDGADVSPVLNFSDIPESATSLVLIMDDPDAPMGTWVHWLIWNIPPNTAGFSKGENMTFPRGMNDFGQLKYGGPCPPSGTHRYYFKLYAVDTMLDLNEGASKAELVSAISEHIVEETQLMGTYSR